MEIKFFREKNAKSIQNAEIFTPNNDELKLNLILKLKEKANHIYVILDTEKRNNYLAEKNKLEQTKNKTDEEIKLFLLRRVFVDMLELIETYADLSQNNIVFNQKTASNQADETLNDLAKTILNLPQSNLTKLNLNSLSEKLSNAINVFNLSIHDIKKEDLKVIEKEGSFRNGLIVKL